MRTEKFLGGLEEVDEGPDEPADPLISGRLPTDMEDLGTLKIKDLRFEIKDQRATNR